VIVLIDFPEKAGSSEYTEFFRRIVREGDTRGLQRMLNVFNQLILTIVDCDKFVIFADRGVAISQYFNVSLACDYRVVADDLAVQKAYLRHGLVPKGGGALFVSDRLGRTRAYEVLLSDEDLTAWQALDLGLVDEVVPPAELEKATLAAARRFAARPAGTLSGLKRLMAFRWRDLGEYLELESQEIVRLLRTADFE
jgi:2-(1,2-epoxy-1,2-dihydrophenyl)acetyl-CoA isomerase